MSRRTIVIQLAPPAPPCFATRGAWVEFLVSAVEETKGGRLGPVDMRRQEPRFNHAYDYCQGCLAKHALAMNAQGLCKPDYLRSLIPSDGAIHATGT